MKLSRLHLVRLSRVTRSPQATHYGDPCPRCEGAVGIYCTEHAGGRTTRYLACRECGWKPEDSKWVTSDGNSQVGTTAVVRPSVPCGAPCRQ